MNSCEMPSPAHLRLPPRQRQGLAVHASARSWLRPHTWQGVPLREYKPAADHHAGVLRSMLFGDGGEKTAFQVRYFEIARAAVHPGTPPARTRRRGAARPRRGAPGDAGTHSASATRSTSPPGGASVAEHHHRAVWLPLPGRRPAGRAGARPAVARSRPLARHHRRISAAMTCVGASPRATTPAFSSLHTPPPRTPPAPPRTPGR